MQQSTLLWNIFPRKAVKKSQTIITVGFITHSATQTHAQSIPKHRREKAQARRNLLLKAREKE